MDMATRQKLAALVQRDIDQLREKAEGRNGKCAVLRYFRKVCRTLSGQPPS